MILSKRMGIRFKSSNEHHILHLIDKEGVGGVEILVQNLAESFSSIRCSYLFLRSSKKTTENIFRKHFYKWSISPFFFLIFFLRRENIHLVHTHHRKGFYLMCLISLFLSYIVFVHHEHGDVLQKQNTFYRFFLLLFQKRISRIIAVSTPLQEEIQKIVPHVHCDVLLNPLLSQKGNISLDDQMILKEIEGIKKTTPFLIGYFGRIELVKRLDVLLHALSLLSLPRDAWRAVFLGEGKQKKFLQKLCSQKNLSKNVSFLPSISSHACQTAYSFLDVSVLCSEFEGLSLFLLESLQNEISVIISDVPAPNAYISHEKNGLLYPFGDAKALSLLIEKLFHNFVLRHKIAKSGRLFAEKTFPSQDEYNAHLEKIYLEVLS